MNYQSVEGIDAINRLATTAMYSTLEALENEGLITHEQRANFYSDHVCQLATKDSCWDHIRRLMGSKPDEARVVVVRCVAGIERETND